MATVILKPQQEERILSGHPWVFNTQIGQISGNFNPADIVEVKSACKQFLGRGYINPKSNIAVRILTQEDVPIDKNFFARRIQQAINFRKKIISKETNVFRLVFSESDFLPGLIVDKYGDCLVMQTLTLGMDNRKHILAEILKEILNPKGIYLRNDVPVRVLEGLALEKMILLGKFPTRQEVLENGIRFIVDIENGQKTGFYIDQRDNRLFLKHLAKDKTVLDCFCYSGGFSIYSLFHKAAAVTALDISGHALALAGANLKLNNLNPKLCEFKEANAFDELKRFSREKKKFDLVVLDPPSFTKSKDKIENALRGYREINLRAMQILNKQGILVSATCSYHINDEAFKQIIQKAAKDARRTIRLIKWGMQAQDHPILLNINETSYLRCLIAEVL